MNSTALLERVVAFPTVSRDSNLELMAFVQAYLEDLGVSSRLIYNEKGDKASLWATIGPEDVPGIILSGHTDVVPVEGQSWSSAPFSPEVRNGRVYGRGACDMKGFLASVLAAVPKFVQADLKSPIHLAFSYDEERGCLGVRDLIRDIIKHDTMPWGCIIGEPTQMQPVLGHKGKLGVRCNFKGHACHSAYAPEGVNAIDYASRMIVYLREIQQRLKADDLSDSRFYPPFSTIQVGVIEGGRALNIVPAECHFDWEVRSLPQLNVRDVENELRTYADELEEEMRAISLRTGIDFEQLSEYPGLGTDSDNPMAALIAEVTGRGDFATVAYGTEGGLFSQAGISTVVCGPGDMAQGHQPDEFIEIEQLECCDRMLANLLRKLSASTLSS